MQGRRYTQKHIERLTKLRQLVDSGYRISDVANLQDGELDRIVSRIPVSDTNPAPELSIPIELPKTPMRQISPITALPPESYIKHSHMLIDEMNESGLESLLSRALVSMPTIAFLDRVILPLTLQIGSNWASGVIRWVPDASS